MLNARAELHQLAQDWAVLIAPILRRIIVDITKIAGLATPEFRLLGRADRHREIARKLARRSPLSPSALDDQAANGLRRPPQLIRKTAVLLDLRKCQTGAMNHKRQRIGLLEDIQVFRAPRSLLIRLPITGH
jgi:hypothetical protein